MLKLSKFRGATMSTAISVLGRVVDLTTGRSAKRPQAGDKELARGEVLPGQLRKVAG